MIVVTWNKKLHYEYIYSDFVVDFTTLVTLTSATAEGLEAVVYVNISSSPDTLALLMPRAKSCIINDLYVLIVSFRRGFVNEKVIEIIQ